MKECTVCTFINIDTDKKCDMCGNPLGTLSIDNMLACAKCTVLNHYDAKVCKTCLTPLFENDDDDAAVNLIGNSKKRKSTIICYKCHEKGHTADECNNTNNKKQDTKVNNNNDDDDDDNDDDNKMVITTRELIPLLENCLTNSKIVPTCYKLISSNTTHITQKGVEGAKWACGYRNIQMLCLSLCHVKEYRTLLFNGDGDIPSIYGIQSWIEKAWLHGFDMVGQVDFDGQLLGKDEWIGATEACTLLRFFGIRAHIVDILDQNHLAKVMRGEIDYDGTTLKANTYLYECNVCEKPITGGFRYRCTVRKDFDLCTTCERQDQTNHPLTKIPVHITKTTKKNDNKKNDENENNSIGGGVLPSSTIDSSNIIDIRDYFTTNEVSSSGRTIRKIHYNVDLDDDKFPIDKNLVKNTASKKKGKAKDNAINENARKLSVWLHKYFNDFEESITRNQQLHNSNHHGNNEISKETLLKEGREADVSQFIHPIYLQHQGHSRTVVGFEETIGKTNLLLFDPLFVGSKIKENLQNNKFWQRQIKRQLSTFNEGAYQMVYVAGIMTPEERERSKLIVAKSFQDNDLFSKINTQF